MTSRVETVVLWAVLLATFSALVAEGKDAVETEEGRTLQEKGLTTPLKRQIGTKFEDLYTNPETWETFALGLQVAAVLAQTGPDQDFYEYYRDNIRGSTSDQIQDLVEELGELAFPLEIALYAIAKKTDSNGLRKWAEKSITASVAGFPMVVVGQRLLGSDRPSYGVGSSWRPLRGKHAISGHTFGVAVPMIVAAEAVRNPTAKRALYLAPLVVGLARINNNAHYVSQVFLGYLWAWQSVRAKGPRRQWQLMPVVDDVSAGLVFRKSWQ